MIVRENRAWIGFSRRCVEIIVEYDQRKSIVSKCDVQTPQTCFEQNVRSSLVPQHHASHHNVRELSHMEAMVLMVAVGWALTCINMYSFPVQ